MAEIAMRQLDTNTKKKVLTIPGNTTPKDASTWMDDMRSNHYYDFMKPWHYVDFPKGSTYPAAIEENAVTEITSAYLN